MRIISNFRDYYDSVLISSEPVWERRAKEFKLPDSAISREIEKIASEAFLTAPIPMHPLIDSQDYRKILLGFCGKLYPVHIYYARDEIGVFRRSKSFLSVDEYEEHFKTFHKERNDVPVWRRYRSARQRMRSDTIAFWYGYEELDLSTWDVAYQQHPVLAQLFIDHNTPIFIIRSDSNHPVITINPSLQDWLIQSIFDPWTAAQEIEMFLGNNLVDISNPPCIMTDNLKRDAHGFTGASFKNVKGHKRGRK